MSGRVICDHDGDYIVDPPFDSATHKYVGAMAPRASLFAPFETPDDEARRLVCEYEAADPEPDYPIVWRTAEAGGAEYHLIAEHDDMCWLLTPGGAHVTLRSAFVLREPPKPPTKRVQWWEALRDGLSIDWCGDGGDASPAAKVVVHGARLILWSGEGDCGYSLPVDPDGTVEVLT